MISLNSSSNKYILFIFLISAFLFVGCAGQGVLKKDEKGISSEEKDYYPSDNVLKHVISASIYESQGEFLLALTQYNQALLYDSTDTEIYMAIAEMYQRVGEYESALRVLGRGYKNADEKNDIIRII